jgi:hypothetical protein
MLSEKYRVGGWLLRRFELDETDGPTTTSLPSSWTMIDKQQKVSDTN